MLFKSVFKSSLIVAAIFQLCLTCYIFFDTYLLNKNIDENKFRYSIYVSILALQVFPFCLILVWLVKAFIAYLKKNKPN